MTGVDAWKNRVLPRLDPAARFLLRRPLAVEKDLQREFVLSAVPGPAALDPVWREYDWAQSYLSTAKYRPLPGGTTQYAVSQVVLRTEHEPDIQQHAYVFPSPRTGYGADVYTHQEATITRLWAHEGGDELVPGDPRGLVTGTLTAADVSWTRQPPWEAEG